MSELIANNNRYRRSFASTPPLIEPSNLIGIQRESYEKFLQLNKPIEDRAPLGLQGVFKSVFPIQDFGNRASLQFVSYHLDTPKYDVEECM